jgi:putative nucleotidyltransferase with HDIG domain
VSEIDHYLPTAKLETLLERYSLAFDIPVLVLDSNRNVFLKFPADAPESDTLMRPINIRDALVGFVAIPTGGKDTETCLDFIEKDLSDFAEMGFEMDSLSGEVARNYEEFYLLWKLSSRLGAGLNVDTICKVLAEEVMDICPSRNVSIMLVTELPSGRQGPACITSPAKAGPAKNDDTFLFFPKVSLGEDSSRASMMTLRTDTGLMGYTYKSKEAITVCDVSKDERFEGLPYPVTRILIAPLIVEDAVTGAIVATDKLDGEEFYTTEIKLISSIASECAVSIKKALLFDEIQSILFGTVEAFTFALDAKHPYTYGHSKRVSKLSANIAIKMGLPAETVNWIRLAALLHDTGKIGTPEVILDKETKLEPEEMDRVKQHPMIGARMIENISRMREIAQWICHHHEKYDGTGYPSGLRKDEIPLPSRIIAIADYFDALTSDRSYRKAFSNEKAVEIMKESLGTHFDPVVFGHFEKEVVPTL